MYVKTDLKLTSISDYTTKLTMKDMCSPKQNTRQEFISVRLEAELEPVIGWMNVQNFEV
jgi:hypothetical protein